MWRPWEKRAREVVMRPPSEAELDTLVMSRAQALAKQLMRDLPKPEPRLVNFADVVPVEGYMVYSGHYGYSTGLRHTVHLVTDDHDEAVTVLAVAETRRMRVVRLYKAPDGTLLWRSNVQVAKAPMSESEYREQA